MRYFPGHGGFVQVVAFSPDGGLLASGGADGTVRLWDVVRGEPRADIALSPRKEWVGALAFSPDGKFLVIAYQDGTISLWDRDTQSPRGRALINDQGRITALRFTPRGKHLLWGSYAGGAILPLPRQAGTPPQAFKNGNTGLVFTLAVAPDGSAFATGGTSSSIYVRGLPTGEEVARLAHGDRQGCWSLAYAPNGRTLAATTGTGLQLWDMTAYRLHGQLADHGDLVSGVAFSADGGRLLTCGWDGIARLYAFDAATGQVVRELGHYDWKVGRLFDVALSPDGTLAAAAGNEPPYLVVWDVE